MPGLFYRIHRQFFRLKLRERVARPPTVLSVEFDRMEMDRKTARVLAASNERSPVGVKRLMRLQGVDSPDDLVLERRRYPRQIMLRLKRWVRYMTGTFANDPAVKQHKRMLASQGRKGRDKRVTEVPKVWKRG